MNLTRRQFLGSVIGAGVAYSLGSLESLAEEKKPEYEISESGVGLIKEFEGFRSKPYKCPAGVDTIGYGHVIRKGESYTSITKKEADKLLRKDLGPFERTIQDKVEVPLSQNQYDSLCSFIFNVGSGNFNSSTMLKKLNAKDYTGAANEFPRWNKAGGKIIKGLVNRRAKEKELFNTK